VTIVIPRALEIADHSASPVSAQSRPHARSRGSFGKSLRGGKSNLESQWENPGAVSITVSDLRKGVLKLLPRRHEQSSARDYRDY
jgi:hypothetical protein